MAKRKLQTMAIEATTTTAAEGEVARSPPPKRRRSRKQTAETTQPEQDDVAPIVTTPRRSQRVRTVVTQVDVQKTTTEAVFGGDSELSDDGPLAKTPRSGRKKKVAPDAIVSGEEYEDSPTKKTPRKRRTKVTEPVVYVIPDVEKKETNFRGRLGYACLNTILRNLKPNPIFCSRTCRIATIQEKGMDFVYELGLQNIRDLKKLIEWNEQNKIRFMRMSSEMFPFASHGAYGYNLIFAEKELKEAGDLAKKYGHRLTMHPGQFTQLGTPREEVVAASIKELEYQCEIMDRMGLDQDSVMIIHMGGVHGDKEASLARFKENYKRVPENVKGRLVLENDELCYNLDDLMPICDELDIPIVVDYHHDWIYPSERPVAELIPIINKTWERKGIKVKQHLSEPRPGAVTPMEKRAHADRCTSLPVGLPDDVDLMIEAKDKEQAVFDLYRIYGLEEVIWENLRPPKENQRLATAGKKSSRARKKKGSAGAPVEEGAIDAAEPDAGAAPVDAEGVVLDASDKEEIVGDEEYRT